MCVMLFVFGLLLHLPYLPSSMLGNVDGEVYMFVCGCEFNGKCSPHFWMWVMFRQVNTCTHATLHTYTSIIHTHTHTFTTLHPTHIHKCIHAKNTHTTHSYTCTFHTHIHKHRHTCTHNVYVCFSMKSMGAAKKSIQMPFFAASHKVSYSSIITYFNI